MFLAAIAQGQTDSIAIKTGGLDPEIVSDFLQNKKMNINVEFGTYFSTSPGYGSGFGTYIAPQLSYSVSPRFRVSGGIRMFRNQGLNSFETSPYLHPFGFYGNAFGSLLYVSGDYRLTDKLIVSGTAYKQVDLFRLNQPNHLQQNYDYHGIIMGVDYQLGENFFIHGEVEFSNGNSIYGASPFNSGLNRHDFFHSPGFRR